MEEKEKEALVLVAAVATAVAVAAAAAVFHFHFHFHFHSPQGGHVPSGLCCAREPPPHLPTTAPPQPQARRERLKAPGQWVAGPHT